MNAQVLIDGIVRQVTVLIAQLATSGGLRAPLAHIASEVFIDLARELEAQGVSRKVSADMFGMALRTYLRKIQRLGESSTERGRSLWEAVYGFVRDHDVVTRDDVIAHFAHDDEALVRGVLFDLTESGLVFSTGTGQGAVFRAASDEELGRIQQLEAPVDDLVWAIIYREGPLGRAQLGQRVAGRSERLDAALESLLAEGRIGRVNGLTEPSFVAERFVVPLGAERGWEAAVFDHFAAVVRTVCAKLQAPQSSAGDVTGGSTYTYEVWAGHPMEDEVRGSLQRFRQHQSELRKRLRQYNDAHPGPARRERIVVYGGQYATEEEVVG